MPSLYAEYLQERLNGHTYETEQGFATYFIKNDMCLIEDIYIKPEFRRLGLAVAFGQTIQGIAREQGCKWLMGKVVPSAKNSTISLQGMLAAGYQLASSSHDLIIFKKEI